MNKIFAILKLIVGLISIIVGIIVTIVILQESFKNIYDIGNYIGILSIEIYGFYLFYSGWTELKQISIKRMLIVIGLVFSFINLLFMISLFFSNSFKSAIETRIIVIAIILVIGIYDFVKLKKN